MEKVTDQEKKRVLKKMDLKGNFEVLQVYTPFPNAGSLQRDTKILSKSLSDNELDVDLSV